MEALRDEQPRRHEEVRCRKWIAEAERRPLIERTAASLLQIRHGLYPSAGVRVDLCEVAVAHLTIDRPQRHSRGNDRWVPPVRVDVGRRPNQRDLAAAAGNHRGLVLRRHYVEHLDVGPLTGPLRQIVTNDRGELHDGLPDFGWTAMLGDVGVVGQSQGGHGVPFRRVLAHGNRMIIVSPPSATDRKSSCE